MLVHQVLARQQAERAAVAAARQVSALQDQLSTEREQGGQLQQQLSRSIDALESERRTTRELRQALAAAQRVRGGSESESQSGGVTRGAPNGAAVLDSSDVQVVGVAAARVGQRAWEAPALSAHRPDPQLVTVRSQPEPETS
eukprot:COSAG01_NODE_19836_length_986_cov_1.408117_2_plen_142_part_00